MKDPVGNVYRCARCRYHYKPSQLRPLYDGFVCKDENRCVDNIRRRARDREALSR